MIQTLKVNTIDQAFQGKRVAGMDALVLCDATLGVFTVYAPDAQATDQSRLAFKKSDTSSNAITIAFKNSQSADGITSIQLVDYGDIVEMVTDNAAYQILSVTRGRAYLDNIASL